MNHPIYGCVIFDQCLYVRTRNKGLLLLHGPQNVMIGYLLCLYSHLNARSSTHLGCVCVCEKRQSQVKCSSRMLKLFLWWDNTYNWRCYQNSKFWISKKNVYGNANQSQDDDDNFIAGRYMPCIDLIGVLMVINWNGLTKLDGEVFFLSRPN